MLNPPRLLLSALWALALLSAPTAAGPSPGLGLDTHLSSLAHLNRHSRLIPSAMLPRQAAAPPPSTSQALITTGSDVTCPQYEHAANLSVLALNTTLRSAFIQGSSDGTMISSQILDNAAAQFQSVPPPAGMAADAQLNKACGNLTAVALAGAAANFSAGTVGGFQVKPNDGVGLNIKLPGSGSMGRVRVGGEIQGACAVWGLVVVTVLGVMV